MQPQQIKTKVEQSRKIKPNVFLVSFFAPQLAKQARAGQFVHLKIKGVILRRPISIHNIKGKLIYILVRIRGKGTKILSQYRPGEKLDLIGPLGNGFKLKKTKTNILIAGGIGVAPLVFLAKKLKEIQNAELKTQNLVILGTDTKKNLLAVNEFKKLGFKVVIATEDGSAGIKGNVVSALKSLLKNDSASSLYCCGPEAMFKAIYQLVKNKPMINCQVSFEQFMGCGYGICCGCTIEAEHGYKKVCQDGPVFDIKQIWRG